MRPERPIISGHRWRGKTAGGPRVVTGHEAQLALRRGMADIADVLRPTLGPVGGTVAIASEIRTRAPELLDDGATIVRRVIELPDAYVNMGAMLLRQAVWQIHERVGDGAATTALLSQALVESAARYVEAGGDLPAICRSVDAAIAHCLDELDRIARPVDSPQAIVSVVQGIVRDPAIALRIGEALDAVGWDGSIEIVEGAHEATEVDYVEGIRWSEGALSQHRLSDGSITATADFPRVFTTDRALERAGDVIPIIEACLAGGSRSLAIFAPDIRGEALAALLLNRDRGVLTDAVAVRGPGAGKQQADAIEDIAIVTGARFFRDIEHFSAKSIRPEDLGEARQVWTTRTQSGVLGGKPGIAHRLARIAELHGRIERADSESDRKTLQARLGGMLGISAILRVGGSTKTEQAEQMARVKAACAAGRAAVRNGVVPGAGVAYVRCRSMLDALSLCGDEAVGARIVRDALTVPMKAVLVNAGFEPGPIMHRIGESDCNHLFDVVRQEWVDPWSDGPLDAVDVLKCALELAESTFRTAINIGALVRGKRPEVAQTP